MVKLRKNAGNISNPNVHSIGIIALGSHLENHGIALPIDTDSKIAVNIAFKASLKSGAKFLGIIYPAYELDEINHGIHVPLDVLKENIIDTINSAKHFLNVDKIIIVNAHGGNLPLSNEINNIEKSTSTTIIFNSEIVYLEGPHGGSGELSMGYVLGIVDEKQAVNQDRVDLYEEVGLYGFKQARLNDSNIEAGAKDIEENGVYIDKNYGKLLFKQAIDSVLEDVEKLLN